jgi:hypothetical protein
MAEVTCTWCAKPFSPRRGGSRQRFCCPGHRNEFHSLARSWAEKAVASGTLTISDLQNGAVKPCTLVPDSRTPSPLRDMRSVDPALLDALHKRGRVELQVPIGAEGIARLICLGWLDRSECRQPALLADVLIDLANAALDAGLRPG